MPARRGAASRQAGEWVVRGGLIAILAVASYFIVTFSMAQVAARSNPALAHRLAPYDGRITARLASAMADGEASAADRARADDLARLALRREPTAVAAVSTLGIDAQIRGDTAGARRLFAYALKLSRRDLRTQLWAIEDAVARNDIPGTLRFYDIALRNRPFLGDLLYPVLSGASTDPAIRRELVRTLATRPRWSNSFVDYVATQAKDPGVAAQLFAELTRAQITVPAAAQAGAVTALVNAGRADEAWRYYASVRPGVDRLHSRDPHFAVVTDTPSLLDWMPINEGGVVASVQDNGFEFTVPPSVGGPMLQQMQLLPPGRYRIAGRSSGIEQGERERPYWVLLCRMDGRELGRVEVPNSGVANGRFAGTFSVPAGCPVQTLALFARPSDAIGGVAGRIEEVQLVPA